MFEGIFDKNRTTTTKQAEPTPQRRRFFNNIFSNPTQPAAPASTTVDQVPKTHKFPDDLGGGEFNLPANKLVTSTRSQEAIGPARKDAERDHIISVALGGTSNKENLQYLEDNKSWINRILGRETTLKERQQGKILVEQQLINDFKDGKISLADARGKLLQKQREIRGLDPKQGVAANLIPAIKETAQENRQKTQQFFKGLFNKTKDALAPDNLGTGIDPALRDNLIKRGETDKLKELEREELNKMGLEDYRPFSTDIKPKPTTRAEEEKQFATDLNKSRAGQYFNAVAKNAKKQASDIKSLFTDPKKLLEDPMIKGFGPEATPEERKYAEDKVTNLALAGSTMPLKDISVNAIKAIEQKLGTKLSQVEKDGVLNYLRSLRDTQGLSMVDVTPEGPVFKNLFEKVQKNQPLELPKTTEAKPAVANLAEEAKKYKSAEEFVKAYYTPDSYDLTPGTTRLEALPETGLYHGTGPTSLKSILTDGKLKTNISKLDKSGEKVVSLSGNRGTAGSYGFVFELDKKLPVKEPPAGTVQGDYYKGFEYRHHGDIPLENVKSVHITPNKGEGLDAKIMWEYKGRNPEYITLGELKKKFEDKGIKVFIDNNGTFASQSQLTDIWNEANKAVETKPVVNNDIPFESVNPERLKQIKQYKNAKEFEDSFSVQSPEMAEGTIPKIAAAVEREKAGNEVPGANFFRKVGEAARAKQILVEVDGTAIFRKLGQASRNTGMSSVQEILTNKNRVKPEPMSIETAFHEKGMQQARKYVEDKYTRAESRGFASARQEFSRALKNDSFLSKLKQFWAPVKNQDPKLQEIFKQWTRKKLVGREIANQELPKLEIPNKEGWDVMLEYEKGGETPYSRDIRREFDSLYREAKKRGLEVPYRDNYLPHVYDNTLSEVKTAMSKYMVDQGVDPQMVQDYVEGIKDIPEEVVRALKLNPSFIKSRAFPDYETAIKYGLRPKYTNPAQLLAHYRNDLEQTIANNEFLNALIREGKIFPFEVAPRDFVAVNIPFSGGGYFAEPRLAEMLNGMFRDDNFLNLGQYTVKGTAWLSKKMQEIALSAGIPKTQMNFFSIGQLIKELTAGNIGAFRTFARANFNGMTARYFESNVDVLKEMAVEGVDLGGRIGSYGKVFENLKRERGLINWAGRGWERWFNEKPFSSLLPQLYTETYKNAKARFLKKGIADQEARRLAANVVRNFYGIYEDIGRGKTTEDIVSSVFFAPKFREGIIRSLGNVAWAGVDLVKSVGGIRKPLNPELYKNRRLLLGMVLSFAGYDALNKKLSGHHMWENASGKELELMIPLKNGDIVYLPFMPSYLAFARNMLSGAKNLFSATTGIGEGDFDVAKQKFGSLMSMPIKIVSELWANQDYFGREIWKESDSIKTKMRKIAEHTGLQVTHPFFKQIYNWLLKDKPGYQALSEAIELPFKFGTMDSFNRGKLIQATEKQQDKERKEMDRIRPIYEKAQRLLSEGKDQEANELWSNLSAEDKLIYKRVKKNDQTNKKAEATKQAKANMLPLVKKLQEMKKNGQVREAWEIWNALSNGDKEIYADVKKETGY